jgi:hypothetical protein
VANPIPVWTNHQIGPGTQRHGPWTIPAGVTTVLAHVGIVSLPVGATFGYSLQHFENGAWVERGSGSCGPGYLNPKTGKPSGCGLDVQQDVAPGDSWQVTTTESEQITISTLSVTLN